ncbi:MAG: type II toxin-antitoxin system prevent-host-death family antitoxin [bacterium]
MLERWPITDARKRLTGLSKKFQKDPGSRPVAVTRLGKPVMAVMPWEFYESLVETLEIMGDAGLVKSLQRGLKEAQEGRLTSWNKVKKELEL